MSRDLEVLPVAALRDNYAYLIVDRERGAAVVVDPSEAAPVEAALSREKLRLEAIWLTHHHWDHVGGIDALVEARAQSGEPLPVVGGAYDLAQGRISKQTRAVSEGDEVAFGGVAFRVLEIPGHTMGAIAWLAGDLLFTGDTLFLGGCGRVFEGTMPMMRESLAKLAALPPTTRIYCGHEYTEKNLEFAASVEPHEAAIAARIEAVRVLRASGRPSVPGLLADELRTNPMLRWESPAVRAFAANRGAASDADEIFARVREAKDEF